MSMFQRPRKPVARFRAKARRSQSWWKTGSFGSAFTGPKPCMPPRSWMPFLALAADVAQLRDGGGGVGEQPLLEGGIDPGLRDDARAVARADLRLVGVDQRVERLGIDEALVHQQRFQRAHAELDVGERRAVRSGAVVVLVVVLVAMPMSVMVVAHGASLGETRS